MGFTARSKVITVDGMKYICDLSTEDRVITPIGPSRVTYCGFYPNYDAEAVNIDCGVVVVGSQLMQSWLNEWLHVRAPEEDERIAQVLGLSPEDPSPLGKPLVRDELICLVGHRDYVTLPRHAMKKEMWVFGTENGMAMVGPFIARTHAPLPEGAYIGPDKCIHTPTPVGPLDQRYVDTSWYYRDHSQFEWARSMYHMVISDPPWEGTQAQKP